MQWPQIDPSKQAWLGGIRYEPGPPEAGSGDRRVRLAGSVNREGQTADEEGGEEMRIAGGVLLLAQSCSVNPSADGLPLIGLAAIVGLVPIAIALCARWSERRARQPR